MSTPDDYIGPLFDEQPPDEASSGAPDVPENCLYLPAPLINKPGALEAVEHAYRNCRNLPRVIFEEPPDADA